MNNRKVLKDWRGLRLAEKRSATLRCPKCGRWTSLSNHTISDNGEVNPSLVCPYENCNFHEYVTLEGWKSNK